MNGQDAYIFSRAYAKKHGGGGGSADTYTKEEIDTMISSIEQEIEWKESVPTYADLDTTYPLPNEGWTASVDETGRIYRWNGEEWVDIYSIIPTATQSTDGMMSSGYVRELKQNTAGVADIYDIVEWPEGMSTEDLTTFTKFVENANNMPSVITENLATITWKGGNQIGFELYKIYDLTNIDTITFDITTGSSYSITDERFRCSVLVFPTSINPTQAPNLRSQLTKIFDFYTRNSSVSGEIDVSDLIGEYYIEFAPIGWNATFSNLRMGIPATVNAKEAIFDLRDRMTDVENDISDLERITNPVGLTDAEVDAIWNNASSYMRNIPMTKASSWNVSASTPTTYSQNDRVRTTNLISQKTTESFKIGMSSKSSLFNSIEMRFVRFNEDETANIENVDWVDITDTSYTYVYTTAASKIAINILVKDASGNALTITDAIFADIQTMFYIKKGVVS